MAATRIALVAAVLLATVLLPGTAFGHAQLLSSQPAHGDVLERSPRAVVLTFDEGIETSFVRLQVYDASGRRVDRGAPYHPAGREELVAVRLEPRLAGSFIARYRVISEDGHPVGKRTAFRVKPPARDRGDAGGMESAGGGGGPAGPSMPATEEHAEELTGKVTDTAFAAARGIGYLAMAVASGGVLFLLVVWLPALARRAEAGAAWRAVSESFVARMRRVLLGAVLAGLLSTAAAIVLEGATAAGISFWAALDADILEPVSDTRVVQAWGARIVVWLILGAALLLALRPQRAAVLRQAALGAEGLALGPPPSRTQRAVVISTLVALALTAPMAGHAATHTPSGLLTVTDTLHVLCMSAWLGGLVTLLAVVPGAVRSLAARARTPLLAGVVGRFSRLAMIAVALLLVTGAVQSVALVGSVPALVDTAYGRLVLAKIALFAVLISLGAYNQRWLVPRLRLLAAGGDEPGRAATLLRRSVAVEVGFAMVVLAVTAVLVATEPAADG
jgi:copper transport protein